MEAQILGDGLRTVLFADVGDKSRQINGAERQFSRGCVGARQREKILDQVSGALGFVPDLFQCFAIGFGRAILAQRNFGGRSDKSYWAAQFMGGVGGKLR